MLVNYFWVWGSSTALDNLTDIPLEKTANHGNCNVKQATLDNNILSRFLIYVNDKYLSTYFFFVRMFKRSAIILKNYYFLQEIER